jgi:guanylate kinase
VPDLAVEDGRRPVRAPAGRARRAPAPVAPGARVIAILFVISGPSGAGKGTLIHGVLDRDPGIAAVAVSATTRRQREGEVEGREYYFLSDDEFQRRIDGDAFEEHVSFAGGRYGTLKAEVDRLLAAGRNVILELEVEGSFAIRRRRPDACLIFIDAPLPELDRRLRRRATEMAGEIEMRLAIANAQRRERAQFDHVIVNDDAERAVDELYATMRSEISRRGGQPAPA